MAESDTAKGNRTYSDAQFREYIPEEEGHYTATFKIARAIGCTWETANRRIGLLAEDEDIDIVDLETAELVDPEALRDSARPMFGVGRNLARAIEHGTEE